MSKGSIQLVLSAVFGISLSSALSAEMMGMPDIRYQLFLDTQSDLSAEIRTLAEAGSPQAQVALADILAESSTIESLQDASYWYQQSYQNGHGVQRSVTSLARLADQFDWLTDYNRGFYDQLNQTFHYKKNGQSVITGLEVFITYPDFFAQDQVNELIDLHESVCVDDCQPKLYKAVALYHFQSLEAAEPLFVEASETSTRAIRIYFDALPEEKKFERFSAFAGKLKANIESVETPSKFSVANRLRSVSSEFNQEVVFWLDHAIADGFSDAYAVRAEYMLSSPLNFSYQETEKVIQQVATVDPQKAKLLEASLYIVREWKKLQPDKAYAILEQLDSEGVPEATIGLGDLYSMGGMDQVDQPQAIKTYLRAAEGGNPVGYQKIANIYRGGRGIVNDKNKAFAFGKIALYLGNDESEMFLQSLKEELKPEELVAAEKSFQEYLDKYVMKEGAQ
jgi:alginate biosynthesis protein AlgK